MCYSEIVSGFELSPRTAASLLGPKLGLEPEQWHLLICCARSLHGRGQGSPGDAVSDLDLTLNYLVVWEIRKSSSNNNPVLGYSQVVPISFGGCTLPVLSQFNYLPKLELPLPFTNWQLRGSSAEKLFSQELLPLLSPREDTCKFLTQEKG